MRKIIVLLLIFFIFAKFANHIYGQTMVENKIIYEQKGTRSQKINGYLYVNRTLLPDVFQTVNFRGKTYEFCQSVNPWGNEGYLPAGIKQNVASAKEKISPRDLQKGWYLGNKLLSETPADWLYVTWEGNGAFVSASKIDSFIEESQLPYIRKSQSEHHRTPLFFELYQNWALNCPEKEDKNFILDLADMEIKNPACDTTTYERVLQCWAFFKQWDRMIAALKNSKFIESYILRNANPVDIVKGIVQQFPDTYNARINECLNQTSSIILGLKPAKEKYGYEHDFKLISDGIKALMKL
jgi:hypothetical protein